MRNKLNKKGGLMSLMFLNPFVLLGIGIFLLIVFGLGMGAFFNKLMLILFSVGGGFLILKLVQTNVIPKKFTPLLIIMFIGIVSVAFLSSFFGLASLAPTQNDFPRTNAIVSQEGSDFTAEILAPRTYKEVKLSLQNDDSLPLIITNAQVIAWVGDCAGEHASYLCNLQIGEVARIGGIFGTNGIIPKAWREILDKNHIGISAEEPTNWGFNVGPFTLNKAKDKQVMVIRSLSTEGQKILWTKEACYDNALHTSDCINVIEEIDFETFGYIYADDNAGITDSNELKVFVFTERANTIPVIGWIADILLGKDMTLVAQTTEPVMVGTPTLKIFLIIAGIGFITAVGYGVRYLVK